MRLTDEFKSDLKYYSVKIVFNAIVLIAFFIVFKDCSKKDEPSNIKKSYDSLEVANKALQNEFNLKAIKLIEINKKADSLLLVRQKVVIKWNNSKKPLRDSVIKSICDTVKVLYFYDKLVTKCDSIIKYDNGIINQKDSAIVELGDMLNIKSSLLANKEKQHDIDLSIKDNDIKKQKRLKWRFLGAGVLLGIFTGLVLN